MKDFGARRVVYYRGPFETRSSLLRRACQGQPCAWEQLVHLYAPLVYSWCRRSGLQPDDANNVGQEVFVAVAQSLTEFDSSSERARFRGWLWTIVRSKIANFHRERSGQPQTIGGSEAMEELMKVAADRESPDEQVSHEEETSLLYHRAFELIQSRFSARDVEVFRRVVIGGEPPATTASQLGLAVSTVYVIKWRILQQLREEFSELIEP